MGLREVLKKNIWMDLIRNGGGGFQAESTFHVLFFFNF